MIWTISFRPSSEYCHQLKPLPMKIKRFCCHNFGGFRTPTNRFDSRFFVLLTKFRAVFESLVKKCFPAPSRKFVGGKEKKEEKPEKKAKSSSRKKKRGSSSKSKSGDSEVRRVRSPPPKKRRIISSDDDSDDSVVTVIDSDDESVKGKSFHTFFRLYLDRMNKSHLNCFCL